jgi:hypothetical protein
MVANPPNRASATPMPTAICGDRCTGATGTFHAHGGGGGGGPHAPPGPHSSFPLGSTRSPWCRIHLESPRRRDSPRSPHGHISEPTRSRTTWPQRGTGRGNRDCARPPHPPPTRPARPDDPRSQPLTDDLRPRLPPTTRTSTPEHRHASTLTSNFKMAEAHSSSVSCARVTQDDLGESRELITTRYAP